MKDNAKRGKRPRRRWAIWLTLIAGVAGVFLLALRLRPYVIARYSPALYHWRQILATRYPSAARRWAKFTGAPNPPRPLYASRPRRTLVGYSGVGIPYWLANQVILPGAGLPYAPLAGAILQSADLRGADLAQADLRRADLESADLSETNLSGARLNGADLRWADLSNADLRRADLTGARLEGTDLRGAKYDDTTRWPHPGYDPRKHGAVKLR